MRRFHENLTGRYQDERRGYVGRAMSKAEALREAKVWLRRYEYAPGVFPFEHPCYWAPFILIGDPW
jgi:CHAT domain-containing protein